MKAIRNKDLEEQKPILQKTARIAGITFLFNLIVPTLGYVFIQSRLFVEGNLLATAGNILKNEDLFRTGILLEMFLAIGLIALGYSLYVLLKSVNPYLAKIAYDLKKVEAALMAVVSLFSFFALQLLLQSFELDLINDDKVVGFAGFIFMQHGILNAVPMFILGIEMVLFNLLLYQSAFIPRWISVFGIFSFSLIFIYAVLSIIHPMPGLMLLTLPSFIFELICGVCLLIRPVRI